MEVEASDQERRVLRLVGGKRRDRCAYHTDDMAAALHLIERRLHRTYALDCRRKLLHRVADEAAIDHDGLALGERHAREYEDNSDDDGEEEDVAPGRVYFLRLVDTTAIGGIKLVVVHRLAPSVIRARCAYMLTRRTDRCVRLPVSTGSCC